MTDDPKAQPNKRDWIGIRTSPEFHELARRLAEYHD